MTAQKPPDKTLVGMPADLKAVLEKLDQVTADKSAFGDPPRGSAFDPKPGSLTQRPTAPPPLSPRASTAPEQFSAPPPLAPAADPSAPAMDRTLIGMPTDMQAALARALAEQAARPPEPLPPPIPRPEPAPPRPAAPRTPPGAAGPPLLAQPVRAVGVPGAESSQAQVPVQGTRGPRPAPKPTVPASYQQMPPRAAPTYSSGLGYQGSSSYQDPSRPVLAPQAPLDWPPAARRSEPSVAPVRLDQTADAEPESEATLADEDVELSAEPESSLVGEERSRLALPLATFDGSKNKTLRTSKTRPRWVTFALSGLAVAVLTGAGFWLVPRLLAGRAASAENSAEGAPPTLPSMPAPTLTETSAATDALHATPMPMRPPAAPAMTSGTSAQLEKQAIERLMANDYAAAKQLYQRLRSAEPSRPEFALMVEILERNSARTCGQPGQAPCPEAQP